MLKQLRKCFFYMYVYCPSKESQNEIKRKSGRKSMFIFMIIIGQERLSKGYKCPTGLGPYRDLANHSVVARHKKIKRQNKV